MNLRALAVKLHPTAATVSRHQEAIRLIEDRMGHYTDRRDVAACADLIIDHYDRIADILDRSPTARLLTATDAETARTLADAYHAETWYCEDWAQAEERKARLRADWAASARDMEPDEWISGDPARWTPARLDDERKDAP
ncbi:hypothetical protein QLQ12_25010 [Actinoplanes sp. NEAU-A12]|uniref:Uncharacterized protein n=1 Tax=Actinoplanes sandaracinus TaxID=3045177 RepID=A0ABT6WQ57_9ACTN|nr:hypothetical protein [Actinoplanes sandaracinus]MDI6101883.1 hypothetical protein [Actinoplanes sandaracinus]